MQLMLLILAQRAQKGPVMHSSCICHACQIHRYVYGMHDYSDSRPMSGKST